MNVSVCGALRHARLVPVALVLPSHDLSHVDRTHRIEDLRLLVAQRLGGERRRRLHRDEPEHLEQVGDDHVAVCAGLVVELGPSLDGQRLGHVDLHVARRGCGSRSARTGRSRSGRRGCCRPPPSRGSGRCGRCTTRRTRRARSRSVRERSARSVPNGFSMITCASSFEPGRAEHRLRPSRTRRAGSRGGARAAGCPPIALLRLRDRLEEWRRVVRIGGAEVERGLERLPRLAGGLHDAELADRVLCVLAELRGGDGEARR